MLKNVTFVHLAQLVEQYTVNVLVGGSNPSMGAITINRNINLNTFDMKRFVFILSVMLMACVSLFAQDAITLVDVAAPDYSSNFTTFAALVAIVPFVVEAFKKLLPNASHGVQVAISWVVGIVVTMFGWLFGLGFLSDITWYSALLYGFGVSLAANGIFDSGVIEWVIGLFVKNYGKPKQ